MKKRMYMVAFIWMGIGMMSCEKELKEYDGQEGVYFYVQWGAEWGDTTKWANQFFTPVEFVSKTEDTVEVKLRVMVTGRKSEYDRIFRIVVDDSTTAVEGMNYEPFAEEQVIKAGTFYTDVPIRLMRTENIQKVMKELRLKLLPTADLIIGIPEWKPTSGLWSSDEKKIFDASEHLIRLSDFVVKPPRWIGGLKAEPGDPEAGRWGVFTEKKYRLICDKFNLTYDDFKTPETMPGAKQAVIQEFMAKYLQELYDKKTPVLEDDGRLMWFMGVSWSSVVGVPYVPEK